MKLFKSILLASTLAVASLSSYASTMSFSSSTDDVCVSGCSVTDDTDRFWVNPTGTALDGASWIQSDDSWYVDESGYAVYELDFTGYTDYILTSLFVSYDDELKISIGDTLIFDSEINNLDSAWTFVTDVFSSSLLETYIAAGDTLSFAVVNSDDYATGVIWSGTATSVPEPSMVIALGLGLVAFGVRRRKNTNV
jgi:hypothetical protein